MAAQEGHADVLATLLEQENKTCLDAVDDRGRTPLMYAAASGEREVTSFLLGHNFLWSLLLERRRRLKMLTNF